MAANEGVEKFIRYFPKIILFGDSLTQFSFGPGGFGAAIANHFQRKCDVLNRGFSGYTTRSDKLILPELLQNDNHPPGCILAAVILLGSNDSESVDYERTRYVPIEEYKDNLRNICKQFCDVGVPFRSQILVTPPPFCIRKWKQFCKETGFYCAFRKEDVEEHALACFETAKELGIDTLDLWSEMQKREDWEDMVCDGLHLSEKGNQFVSQALIPMLEKKLPNLTIVFPDWEMVHPKEPEKSFNL